MIPVRLRLKNFLPYRGEIPPFSFQGIHLACISGDNGAGKTSIIDAITWALWGKSRLRSKSTTDDDLITQGEQTAEVAFDFLAGDGQVYRVERKRTKPKKSSGSGQSELKLFHRAGDEFKDISGSVMSETGEQIKKLLHLDYDTFINSAYLKQGEADHFTELRPNERKEVLANILGLDIYDSLAANAKTKASEAASYRKLLAERIKLEMEKLQQRPELEKSLDTTSQKLTESRKSLNQKQLRLDELRGLRQKILGLEDSLRQTRQIIKEIEKDMADKQAELERAEKRIEGYQAVIAEKQRVEEGFAAYQAVKQKNEVLNQKLTGLRQKEAQAAALRQAITEARHSLERKHDEWKRAYDDLAAKSAALESLRSSLKETDSALGRLAEREKQLETLKSRVQELKIHIAGIDSEVTRGRQNIEEIREKVKLLAASEAAACPVCETELSQERLSNVKLKYEAEMAEQQGKLDEMEADRKDKLGEIAQIERELEAESALKAERNKLSSQQAVLLKNIEEAEGAAKRLPEGQKQLGEISARIQKGDYAPDENTKLAEITKAITELDYDAEEHRRVSAEIKTLEIYDRQQRELSEAEKLLASEQSVCRNGKSAIAELKKRLEARRNEAGELTGRINELPRIEAGELEGAERELQKLTTEVGELSEQLGGLKQNLAYLDDLEKEIAEKTAEMNRHAAAESIYKELQEAFGKKIPALIIENAIPEMEAEANRLLARMTDNRMSLKLELQRTTRKGETAETFDIKIADELGTRDYDLFSGGEAFRINLALRLALSRLLVNRKAGAPLRTLIIDEGFGTQDASGIDKLKEAISSIQNQFDCILVITHIEEFKEAFPARIEVLKTADGSDIKISYN